MSNILIVEDEAAIAEFIARGLAEAGHETEIASTGTAATLAAVQDPFDLIILDVGLPDFDGFEVLRRLRGQGVRTPVIMLTARTSPADTVRGLEGGADDYVPKPFSFEVLLARVRLRLRQPDGTGSATLSHRGWTLDLVAHTVSVDGKTIELSQREFALLEAFVRRPGVILSREQLLKSIWGYDFDPGSNVVDVYIRYLRRKLGNDFLETVRGAGYRLP